MNRKELLLGNEAIARGLVENGCTMATSYPGTPASEILAAVSKIKTKEQLRLHVQWAVNEKVAFEIAYAGAITGLRAAVSMKQVGLNVALDPFMSAAYMGTKGGFVVISADDPGPHSSQTEQDSRLTAMSAKVPVLDPLSPKDAKELISSAYALSEEFEVPVMLRPTTRVCHSRQDVEIYPVQDQPAEPVYEKNPSRWAATPKFRFHLHTELEKKIHQISGYDKTKPVCINQKAKGKKAVLVSGVAAAHTIEIMEESMMMDSLRLFRVLQPYPLHRDFMENILETYDEILVIEETMPVMEMQLGDIQRVKGKRNNFVPSVGEILPEKIEEIIHNFAGVARKTISIPSVPGKRPTLCAGCPHRASFFAIKKAAPKGIYTSDIGCYTLGLNLGAVDTVLCMGAAISQAAGFYHAFKKEDKPRPIVATIGDSTFFHAGVPALIDAVSQNVRMTLVILDNRTTAMTGNQPTPASGFGACGEPLQKVNIPDLVKGCGVEFVREGDPYDLKGFTALVKEASSFAKEKGPAVVIAKHPCLLDRKTKGAGHTRKTITITEDCDGCLFCIEHFECPALVSEGKNTQTRIDPILCVGCGVCETVCPKGAIQVIQ